MSRYENTEQVTVRVPSSLRRAVQQRAEALAVREADVARVALAREVSQPLDRRARSFVDVWLEGAEDSEPQGSDPQ